jgi:hypothetical protein
MISNRNEATVLTKNLHVSEYIIKCIYFELVMQSVDILHLGHQKIQYSLIVGLIK